ncbi:unc-17 [Pristionchus pacificus]|nr:unc-17 [Pristionchus pacificus]
MGFNVPVLNRDSDAVYSQSVAWTKANQKKLVLIIVSVALLLDNMLYMVIVPIIPHYLRQLHNYDTEITITGNETVYVGNNTYHVLPKFTRTYVDEDIELGWLFASKALLQIFVNPLSGFVIDRIGYEIPMIIGLSVMFASTSIFSLGKSYGVLFFARSLQGFGSAFADTAGLAMIADRFTEDGERSAALGIALAFISFGCLVAPPFGSVLYDSLGKNVPFLILACVCLIDAIAVFMVIQPRPPLATSRDERGEKKHGTPMWKLFMDPYIACCSGALIMANVSLAFLEPTIGKHILETMPDEPHWKHGAIWLPAFVPHVIGVYVTVKLLQRFPRHTWAIAMVGLAMEGIACLAVPFMTTIEGLVIPLSFVCFGIALIDTSLLPMLAHLVDTRHVSVYGSVYAIADISYSFAYAFGPIIASGIVNVFGFTTLNAIIFVTNVGYVPVLWLLAKVDGYSSIDKQKDTTNGTQLTEHAKNEYGAIGGAMGQEYPPAAQTQSAFNGSYQAQTNPFQPQPEFPPGYDPLNPAW